MLAGKPGGGSRLSTSISFYRRLGTNSGYRSVTARRHAGIGDSLARPGRGRSSRDQLALLGAFDFGGGNRVIGKNSSQGAGGSPPVAGPPSNCREYAA